MNLRTVERSVGAIALVLGFIATGVSTYTQIHENHQAACYNRIDQEFLSVIKQRSAVQNENTANLNYFVEQAIESPKYTQAQKEAFIHTYLTELAKINGELRSLTFPNFNGC